MPSFHHHQDDTPELITVLLVCLVCLASMGAVVILFALNSQL